VRPSLAFNLDVQCAFGLVYERIVTYCLDRNEPKIRFRPNSASFIVTAIPFFIDLDSDKVFACFNVPGQDTSALEFKQERSENKPSKIRLKTHSQGSLKKRIHNSCDYK